MGRIASRETKALGRQAARTEIKTTAYESGIDPNAWIGDVASKAIEVGGKFIGAGSGIGAAGKAAAANPDAPDGGATTGDKSAKGNDGGSGGIGDLLKNPLVLVGAGLALFMLMKKKR